MSSCQQRKCFFIFVSIQKPTNTFNHLTNSNYKIYIFYFSYIFYFIVNLFYWQINTYLLTYLLTYQKMFCKSSSVTKIFPTGYFSAPITKIFSCQSGDSGFTKNELQKHFLRIFITKKILL